ncbi:hypothetical protein COU60_00720 [Candidatus Pacearchaeota archaeon CG10_big_fil_rev_8_21_14_0_10_34_76]|nr:MAG: hypothetical protein COU60_00720 [Candidatus Pacearchaeota archaeon CG10_big_fil_rev_8_21_14_0_10_34_76]
MIFVSVGTHNQEFERLIRKIDNLAKEINEEIIIQRGHTKYIPKNCKSFKFDSDLKPYMKKARLIIAHAGIGTTIEVLRKLKKPLILIPRQHKYGEHINDHQVGMARHFEKKWGVKIIYNIKDLTSELIKRYDRITPMNDKKLIMIRNYLKGAILGEEDER